MKLNKILLLSLTILLTGCNVDGEPPIKPAEKYTAICPTGGPAIALSCLASNSGFETTSDPSLLPSYFAAGKYDLIVAPTDVGVKSIKNGCNYKLAATITYGNFYLVSTGKDDNNVMDEGDSVVLFQQGGLPDKIFHYIYGNDFNSTITYVKNVAVAANAYDSKTVTTEDGTKIDADYVLLAEPKLTALNIESEKVISLNEKFEEKSGVAQIYQASIFTKNGFNADNVLEKIKNSVTNMTQVDKNEVKNNMNVVNDPQTFFGMSPELAYKCINNNNSLGLCFIYAKDAIPAIKNYLSIIGVEDVNEEIFKQ